MDDERFDHLAAALAAGPSRRGLLRLIAGGLVALFGRTVSDKAAAKKKRNKKRKCRGDKKTCGKRCIPKTSCCTTADCPSPSPAACEKAVCANGRCETALLPTGSPCASDQFCLVGTTCNADGECQGGSPRSCGDGIDCTTDPNHCGECGRRCLIEAPPTCGETGQCAGGICLKYGTGPTCRPRVCLNDSTLRLAGKCDGNGGCPPSQTQDCAPYKCQTGSCLTECDGDEDCIASHFCEGTVCNPRE